jgi:hypothetical protein
MSISLHKLVSILLMGVLMIAVHSCVATQRLVDRNGPLTQSTQSTHLASSQEPNMVKVIYPSLRLVANGSTVLLDKVNQGFQVYSVPDLTLRLSKDSYQDIVSVVLSNSGQSVGVHTTANELVLLTSAQRNKYKLPRNREFIRSLAISDVGDRLAILAVDNSANASSNDQENGVLEIWSLPLGDRPLAAIKLPVFDSAAVTANGAFSSFAVQSTGSIGSQQFIGVYQYTQTTGTLSAKWTESGDSSKSIAVALYKDWVWAVQAKSLVGWHQNAAPIELPGTPREHLIYSPTGSHLLAYRGEESINLTSEKTLFRLFDLSLLKEVKQTTHVIEDRQNAQFVLSKDLSLIELRANRDGKIQMKELGWQAQGK